MLIVPHKDTRRLLVLRSRCRRRHKPSSFGLRVKDCAVQDVPVLLFRAKFVAPRQSMRWAVLYAPAIALHNARCSVPLLRVAILALCGCGCRGCSCTHRLTRPGYYYRSNNSWRCVHCTVRTTSGRGTHGLIRRYSRFDTTVRYD